MTLFNPLSTTTSPTLTSILLRSRQSPLYFECAINLKFTVNAMVGSDFEYSLTGKRQKLQKYFHSNHSW